MSLARVTLFGLAWLALLSCRSHRERNKPFETTEITEAEQRVLDADTSDAESPVTDNSLSEILRCWMEIPDGGVNAFVAGIRAIREDSPMVHAYPGATEGRDLSLRIDRLELQQTIVKSNGNDSADMESPYAALVMPLRLTNKGTASLSLTLRHESHGRTRPATDLGVCVRERTEPDARASGKWDCGPLYQLRLPHELPKEDTLHPGATMQILVRMDWAGRTPGDSGPLMPLHKAATYGVQVVAFYRQRASWHFAIGRSTLVRVKL